MATNRTDHLGLNDWVGTDAFRREELNENFRKIDAVTKGQDDKIDTVSQEVGEVTAQLTQTEQQLPDTINLKQFGAKADSGFDNSQALIDAMDSLQSGQTLIIPMGMFEYATDWVINKSNISIIFYGSLKYTGTGSAVTQSGVDQVIHNPKITRDFPYNVGGNAADVLIGTGWRFYGVKKSKIFNPFIRGFKDGFLHDTSNGKSNAYIDIFTPKVAECLISYNRPVYPGVGWANEVSIFGGGFEIGGFSNYSGSKYFNIEAGDNHKFYSMQLESQYVDRRILCGGSNNKWVGCRFEGTNGVCDIEITGNRNRFIASDSIDWQLKVIDKGQYNDFDYPAQNWKSIADRVIYVDAVNGSDSNQGLTQATAVKTCQRAVDLLPRMIDHNFTITVLAGTTTDGFIISDIRGKGKLSIIGDTATPTNCKVKYVSVRNVHLLSEVIVHGLECTSFHADYTRYAGVYVEDANADIRYISCVNVASRGILAGYNGKVYVRNSTISNKTEMAIGTTGVGGVVTSWNNYGTANVVSMKAASGTIHMSNEVTPEGTTKYVADSGGLIVSKNTILV